MNGGEKEKVKRKLVLSMQQVRQDLERRTDSSSSLKEKGRTRLGNIELHWSARRKATEPGCNLSCKVVDHVLPDGTDSEVNRLRPLYGTSSLLKQSFLPGQD